MNPLEWLARLCDHIPDPGQHRTLFYGEYSNRVRGCGEPAEPAAEAGEEHRPRRRASPSWGRLIAKVYQVDPLVCTRCGKRMSVVAFVTDSAAIGRILDHLGLSNTEAEKRHHPYARCSASPSTETVGASRWSGTDRLRRLPTDAASAVPHRTREHRVVRLGVRHPLRPCPRRDPWAWPDTAPSQIGRFGALSVHPSVAAADRTPYWFLSFGATSGAGSGACAGAWPGPP